MQTAIARLALVAFGLTLSLAAIEVALRVLSGGEDSLQRLHQLEPDADWLYRMQPSKRIVLENGAGVYETNEDGFRGAKVTIPKPDGTFRVAVVGDSVAFGYRVAEEDSYPSLLEKSLRAQNNQERVETINLGVSGYNSYTEAALFAEVGARYAADLVLVQFCINDLNDPTLHFDFSTQRKLGPLPDEAFPDPEKRRPIPATTLGLCNSFHICRWLHENTGDAETTEQQLDAIAPNTAPTQREIAWLEANYRKIAAAAERHGGKLALVLFPYELEGSAAKQLEISATLRRMAAANGWPVIDLGPAFEAAAAAGRGPLFIDLYHPTPLGYAVAAEASAKALQCGGLLPWHAPVACEPQQ